MASLNRTQDTAETTLAEIRGTLDRWDKMKARFGEALDAALHRAIDAMREDTGSKPTGPPSGAMAHGFDVAEPFVDPKCVVQCDEVARPKMNAGVAAHEYHDSPDVLRAKVKMLAG